MLGEAVRLETVEVGAGGGWAEVLQGEFFGAGTVFAAGTGIGAAGWGIEAATNIAGCSGVLGE
jgi:hypothetical protein